MPSIPLSSALRHRYKNKKSVFWSGHVPLYVVNRRSPTDQYHYKTRIYADHKIREKTVKTNAPDNRQKQSKKLKVFSSTITSNSTICEPVLQDLNKGRLVAVPHVANGMSANQSNQRDSSFPGSADIRSARHKAHRSSLHCWQAKQSGQACFLSCCASGQKTFPGRSGFICHAMIQPL